MELPALTTYDAANRLLTLDNQMGGTIFSTFDYGYNSVNNAPT